MDEKEYIEREAVIEMANELYTQHLTLRSHEIGSAILDFNQSIRKAPAADVAEVRHGHWVKRISYPMGYNCSECNHSEEYKTPYCKICGAKMDGKGEGYV